MTTAARRPSTVFSSIFHWQSLRTRVTLLTLIFLLVGLWSLAFYISYALQDEMKNQLGEQQLSAVSIIASGINQDLEDRVKSLEMIAARITPTMLGNQATIQKILESH